MLKLISSPIIDVMFIILNYMTDLDKMALRNTKISKYKSSIKYRIEDNTLKIYKESGNSSIRISITNYSEFIKKNPSLKIIIFLLYQINRCAVADAKITTDTVEFDIDELVDFKMYTSTSKAKISLIKTLDALKNISFGIRVGDEKFTDQQPLITDTYNINKKVMSFKINTEFPWEILLRHFMTLPKCYFSLSKRASTLLYFCSYMARQNTRDLCKYGYFDIKLRTVQYRLNLPDGADTKSPGTVIKAPIRNVVEEINQTLGSHFFLELIENDSASIEHYLNGSFIRVRIDDTYRRELPNIAFMKKRATKN